MSRAFIRTLAGAAAVLALLAPPLHAEPATGTVNGVVSIPGPDGQPILIPGVTLTLSCALPPELTAVSDELGEYRFADVPSGTCTIVAELQGFKSTRQAVTVTPARPVTVTLRLGLDTLTEQVDVRGTADAVADGPMAAHVERMTSAELQTAPLASERFQDALPLIPGVVRGPDGLLNVNGTRSNQSALMFNDADGTDPVTGEHALELPIDAVRSVRVRGAAYSPEFGQSVGAVTSVETQQAGEAWHVTLNDLEPRLRRRAGAFRGVESWTPRVTLGGPVVRGKVSVLQSIQYERSQTQVFSLPPLESDTKVESFETFSRADWTVSPTNRFAATITAAPRKTTYAGLNTFNPQRVTPTVENHGLLATAADQVILGERGVVDLRASLKEFDATIDPSAGRGPMILAPDVNAGSYFNSQDRQSRRVEWSASYAVSPFGPSHLVKSGVGITFERFTGVHQSRPVEIVRQNATLAERLTFTGPSAIGSDKTAVTGYGQDSWTVSRRITVQGGGRFDYDSITGDAHLAPRGSATALLSADGRTVLRAGFGVFYNPLALNVAAFDQLQSRVVTDYAGDGVTLVGAPTFVPNVVVGRLHAPRATTWNAEIDRELVRNLFLRIGFQQRDSRFESVLDPVRLGNGEALALSTDGESRYREGQITVRYQFNSGDQIVASYTRSSAIGDLNDFNSYFGNIENPVIRANARGPLAWDAPDRVLVWANLKLPYDITFFPLVDVRSGFPLSIVDEARNFVGARNSGRYPRFFSLDTQVSKRFKLFGHNATIGVKIFNLTDHFNPRDFQGNLASAEFGGFANGVGRTFRGRWIFEF